MSQAELLLSASLGHTCYLKLARGITYTLHVSPPRDGSPRAILVVLKGPPMSFFHLVSIHLKLARAGHLLHAGELPGSLRCPLVRCFLHVICHKDSHNVIIFPAVEARPVAKMLICHSVLISPSSTYFPVLYYCIRL
jgi:hypothetical protein